MKSEEEKLSVHKFGEVGRLFPYLNQEVGTPKGKGTLLQVFTDHVRVALKSSPKRMTRFKAEEIQR